MLYAKHSNALSIQLRLNLDVMASHAELLALTMLDASMSESAAEGSSWAVVAVHCAILCEAYLRMFVLFL
jgi:hypothetical protein